MTEMTVPCTRFAGTAQRIVDAQKKLYSSEDATGAIEALAAELEALKDGAPADVQAALDTLSQGFEEAAALMADPEAVDQEKFAELATDLSAAGQKVSAYVVEQCS